VSGGVVEVVGRLELLDVGSSSREAVGEAFADVARVQGWLDVKRACLTRRLNTIAEGVPSMFADAEIAAATRSSRRDTGRASRRAKALDDVPELEVVLAAGDVSVEHVDAVATGDETVAASSAWPVRESRRASRRDRGGVVAGGVRGVPECRGGAVG